jgi:hypothetical protein
MNIKTCVKFLKKIPMISNAYPEYMMRKKSEPTYMSSRLCLGSVCHLSKLPSSQNVDLKLFFVFAGNLGGRTFKQAGRYLTGRYLRTL